MSEYLNGLSIIIPSKGRIALLRNLLQSIREDAAQLKFPIEIILVDDTPKQESEDLRMIVKEFSAKVLTGESHVGGKRNYGAHKAIYEYILFLDSDIVIHKGTLEAHFKKLSLYKESKIAACLGLVTFVGQTTFAWEVISEMQLTLPFSYPLVAETVPWGPTANISFRKDIFLKLGGFDITLPKYGGEDVDLGLRMTRLGYTIVTTKDAVADHTVETWNSWKQNFKRLYYFGLADYHLMIRHTDRTFLDFPSAQILWCLQILTCIILYFILSWHYFPVIILSLILSVLSYHFVYALVKKGPKSKLRVHLFGPIVFYIMDTAKCIESIRNGKFALIFRRIKFIDDIISQDWAEIAASAWGLTAASMIFFGSLIISFIFNH